MSDAGEIAADRGSGEANGDALRLPFPDDTFDRIIVSEVLEHLWDDERVILGELVRVLRVRWRRPRSRCRQPLPRACVRWAINPKYFDTPGGHVRIYRQHELEQKLERAGLIVKGQPPRARATRRTGG